MELHNQTSCQKGYLIPLFITAYLPLIDLLEHFARRGGIPNPFRFHVLGEGRQRMALYAGIIRNAVREIYGVDLIMTWDTAAGIAALSMGAFVELWDTQANRLQKEDLSGNSLARSNDRERIYGLINQELGSVFTRTVDAKNFPLYNADKADYNLYFVETVGYAASHKGAERHKR